MKITARRRAFRDIAFALLAAAACGLAGQGCKSAPPPPPIEPAPTTQRVGLFLGNPKLVQQDPLPAQDYLIQLVAYRISVPVNSVSQNEAFWKHIDETTVDPATHDVLWKNGVRVGVAKADEWDFLKDILNQNPAITQPSAYSGREARDIELELKMKVESQNLFYYNPGGDLIGRTYDRCDNLVRLSFQSAPRKPGVVRLTLCPVVRSLREVLIPVGEVKTLPFKFVHPEQLFDLNLICDVPLEGFLVAAPSPEGKWPTSLGSTFLIADGAAEQTESLLVFRPVVYRQKIDRSKDLAATPP